MIMIMTFSKWIPSVFQNGYDSAFGTRELTMFFNMMIS